MRSDLDLSGPVLGGRLSGASGVRSSMSSLFVLLSSTSSFLNSIHNNIFSPPFNSIIIVPALPRRETGSPAAQGCFCVFDLLSFLHNLAKSKAFKKEAMTEFRVPGYLDPGGCMKHRIDS